MSNLTYRADIDGLRAFAVIAVILFHINHQWLPSGFLGVDIFFVISGFLITSILYRDMQNGIFSFTEFYNRRIKRILPVFFVVLFTGVLATSFLFLPTDRNEVFRSVLFSVFFLANIFFSRGSDYFGVSSNEKPFLHIWSLSVEEQFYFVFPLFLFLFFRFSRLKKYLLKVVVALILLLFISSFYNLNRIGIRWEPYYLPHIRGFEMLIGSALAIFMIKKPYYLPQKIAFSLALFSLFIIVFCIFLGNVFTPPPPI